MIFISRIFYSELFPKQAFVWSVIFVGLNLCIQMVVPQRSKVVVLRICAGWSEHLLVAHTTFMKISCYGSHVLALASSDGLDEPVHPCRLNRAFTARMYVNTK